MNVGLFVFALFPLLVGLISIRTGRLPGGTGHSSKPLLRDEHPLAFWVVGRR